VIVLRLQKWRETGLIHRPHKVDEVPKTKHFDALGKADPCDRPQKIKCGILMTNVSYSGNNHKEARSSSWPYISCNVSSVNEYDKAVDLNDQLKFFLSHSLSICSNLADDGKLGYGFTLADELGEVDIGPGDKPRPIFISKKLDLSLREPMIALLKEYSDCFAWGVHRDAWIGQKHRRTSVPSQERILAILATSVLNED
jgi:hypothetical protein